jgi:acrylyl-CoA reductase (NADPH)
VRAFIAEKTDDDVVRELRTLDDDELGEGDVLIRVAWSSVNYKDALATIPKGQVARISPLVPGIDLAGVVESGSGDFAEGDAVLAHGYDLGVAHHGGYAEYARVPADWVVPLPDGLNARDAMAIGTAGYTAARSVEALESFGLSADAGPVLVTGASGGVGSVAVDILAGRGYEVVASSGKDPEWLRGLGAASVISREDAAGDSSRPLEKTRWAGAVDCVGGETLAGVLRGLRYGAAVAASGNTGGIQLPATVLPFILRGVSLLGIDSVMAPRARRVAAWDHLARDLDAKALDSIAQEISLGEAIDAAGQLMDGKVRGRIVVDVNR